MTSFFFTHLLDSFSITQKYIYLDYIVYIMSKVFSIRIPGELKGMMLEVEVD